MLFYDISNLKILMSQDSRGCKQSILKKWLTEALNREEKGIRLPYYVQDQTLQSLVLLNELGA